LKLLIVKYLILLNNKYLSKTIFSSILVDGEQTGAWELAMGIKTFCGFFIISLFTFIGFGCAPEPFFDNIEKPAVVSPFSDGDGLGAGLAKGSPVVCRTNALLGVTKSKERFVICHKNNNTLVLPEAALGAHMDHHNDCNGACPCNSSNNVDDKSSDDASSDDGSSDGSSSETPESIQDPKVEEACFGAA
jgi:hypothetical protein